MLIGSLNNPKNDLMKEAKWVLKNFDFLDLTLEMPKAYPDKIKIKPLQEIIGKHGKPVVGHTAWYLPIGSPLKEIRLFALEELEKCMDLLEKLGVGRMNVHPDSSLPIKNDYLIKFNVWSLKRLVSAGRKRSIRIMLENTPCFFSTLPALKEIFASVPRLYLHLDIAHASIGGNSPDTLVRSFADKIQHVHISDNKLKMDDHLPLGRGDINWKSRIAALKRCGYNDTISLEVFTSPEDRLADKPKLRKAWDNL